MSQSLVNEGRFPHYDDEKGKILDFGSQSLVNEGRFPQVNRDFMAGASCFVSQSLVNEGRFPLLGLLGVGKSCKKLSRNPSLMRAGFHNLRQGTKNFYVKLVAIPR